MQSKKVNHLIALATDKFVGSNPFFFEKIPSYRNLRKDKTVPPFSEFTTRKQKEKAAIAAWQSRFDSGYSIIWYNFNYRVIFALSLAEHKI